MMAWMLMLLASQVPAPGRDADAVIENWIIVSADTALMAGDKPKGKLSPGVLLRTTHRHENWRFSPEYVGWVHTSDMVALDKADAFFTKLIADRPTPAAFQHRGIARAALSQWEKAVEDFQRAADLGDRSPELLINLGNAQRHIGAEEEALASYTAAIRENPNSGFAFLHRGSLLAEQTHWEASLSDLETAVKLVPQSAEAHNHLGVTLRMMGRFDDAVDEYTTALTLAPKHSQALANRGYAQKRLGDFRSALTDYEAALESDPKSVDVLNDLAWLLATCPEESIRNAQRAMELAAKANALEPEPDPDLLDTLAAAQAAAGKFKDAANTAEKALEIVRGTPEAAPIAERLNLYQERKAFVEAVETAESP